MRSPDTALSVVEDAGAARRVVLLRLDRSGALRVEAVVPARSQAQALSSASDLLRGSRSRPVIIVTSSARLQPCHGPAGSGPGPRMALSLSSALRAGWTRAAQAAGLQVLGFYPFAGSALAGVGVEPGPQLLLQVERSATAVIECLGASCRDVAVHPHARPSVERCRELVGEACPLALLTGGGMNLSELGYGLAREGSTWVRLAPLLAHVECDESQASLSAAVGAARHACGLAPEDAVAWLAPAGVDQAPRRLSAGA